MPSVRRLTSMSRSARSPNSSPATNRPRPTTSAVFTAISNMAQMTALVPSRSFSAGRNFPIDRVADDEKSPQNLVQSDLFACDRINGHNPQTKAFEEIRLDTYARMTAIVWYRDDLRISDHSALSAASKITRIGCVHLRARRQSAGHSAAGRRDAMVAGAVVARPAG